MNHEKHAQPDSAPLRRKAAQSTPQAAPPQHPLLMLQRQIGNAAIARQIAQREPGSEEEDMVQAKRSDSVQRQPDTEEEDMVQAKRSDTVQRQPDTEEEDMVQAKRSATVQRIPEVGLEGGEVSADTASAIQSRRGGGSAMPDMMRSTMEQSFNTDFSDVRVHADSQSHDLNERVGAQAFTTGSDIFLGAGASASDQNLMAHELTHVVQQRSMSASGPMRVTAADDQHEQQAEAMASQVAQRQATPEVEE